MKQSAFRQIKDVQHQAEKLIKNEGTIEEIENFGLYSEEIKSYLKENVSESMILKLLEELPNISVELDNLSKRSSASSFFITFSVPLLSTYFRDRKARIEILQFVRDIQGKYASIEYLVKAVYG